MRPLQLAFYRGAGGKFGAIQFNLQRPHFYSRFNPKLRNFEGRFVKEEWKAEYPELADNDLTSREGALFLDITSAKGNNVYDWDNKITMALSITDLSTMLTVLEGRVSEAKILHDPNVGSTTQGKVMKRLTVISPDGVNKKGCLISASLSKSGETETVKHMVPLNVGETLTLAVCVRAAIPLCLGWV